MKRLKSLSPYNNIDNTTTGGNWSPAEKENDKNYQEILAAFLPLHSFSFALAGKHVRVLVDYTTAVSSITNMGTCHSKANNALVREIWGWCINNNVWLTAAYILGKENSEAETESQASR